jgi:hypothetical protein
MNAFTKWSVASMAAAAITTPGAGIAAPTAAIKSSAMSAMRMRTALGAVMVVRALHRRWFGIAWLRRLCFGAFFGQAATLPDGPLRSPDAPTSQCDASEDEQANVDHLERRVIHCNSTVRLFARFHNFFTQPATRPLSAKPPNLIGKHEIMKTGTDQNSETPSASFMSS